MTSPAAVDRFLQSRLAAAGLLSMRGIFVTDDLRSYAYTTYNQVSSLFVSEGRE